MIQLNPYINFHGDCRAAMEFYQQCIGGSLHIQVIGDAPIAAQCPGNIHHHVMHSELRAGGFVLMASDMAPGGELQGGNNISISLITDDPPGLQPLFDGLATGGKVLHPLQQAFWGATFGVLEDRFGIRWLVQCNTNPGEKRG